METITNNYDLWLSDEELIEAGYRRISDEAEYGETDIVQFFSVWENEMTGERYLRNEGIEVDPEEEWADLLDSEW